MHRPGVLLLSNLGANKVKIRSDFDQHGEGYLPHQTSASLK